MERQLYAHACYHSQSAKDPILYLLPPDLISLNLHIVPHLLVFWVQHVLQRASFTKNSLTPRVKLALLFPEHKK